MAPDPHPGQGRVAACALGVPDGGLDCGATRPHTQGAEPAWPCHQRGSSGDTLLERWAGGLDLVLALTFGGGPGVGEREFCF